MQTTIHRADSRGFANHGWLQSYHSFSFASYYNPNRMNFGVLRVLNDDTVAAGMGFGTHPHENMEIVSIPLEGDLEHKDSIGTVSVIKEGDIQVMSAGTGIAHSEYNKNSDRQVKFLQIWIIPHTKNVSPRYDQIAIRDLERPNQLNQVLSPNADDQGVWIHQNAWFHIGSYDEDVNQAYALKQEGHGIYLFVLNGKVTLAKDELHDRDAIGITDSEKIEFQVSAGSRILLMEVPMHL